MNDEVRPIEVNLKMKEKKHIFNWFYAHRMALPFFFCQYRTGKKHAHKNHVMIVMDWVTGQFDV